MIARRLFIGAESLPTNETPAVTIKAEKEDPAETRSRQIGNRRRKGKATVLRVKGSRPTGSKEYDERATR